MRTCPKCGNRYPQMFAACPVDGAQLGSGAPSQTRLVPADPLIGKVVGGYSILDLLGRGGMGAVYRARDTAKGGPVAIKIVHAGGSAASAVRFEREARAMLSLRHPSVVEVHDFGRSPDGMLYMVMELLDGEDLQKRLGRGPLRTDEALQIAIELARALSAAHAKGVVHRDLKPGNVFLVPRGEGAVLPKILDFGVAKLHGETLALTQDRGIIGTPYYMAPEQARGEPDVDARADIYALGAILYEMLTGRVPLSAEGPLTVLVRILTDVPTAPSRLRPSLGQAIDELVLRALAKARAERYPTAQAFGEALEHCLEVHRGTAGSDRWSILSPPTVSTEEVRLMTVLMAEGGEAGDGFEERFAAAAAHHGGLPDRLLGGRHIAVFGAEVSYGDEAVRAVRCGLAVRGPGIRIGIGSGRVLAGHNTTFSGEPVGGAGSLARAGGGSTVLVDLHTHHRTRGLFDVRPVDVGAYEVVAERSRGLLIGAREVMGVETPTLGRDAELAQVRALFHRAVRDRTPQVVSVVGGPGLGKTRIKHELRLFVEGLGGEVVPIEGHGEPMSIRSPYFVYSLALRRLAKIEVGEPEATSREKLLALVSESIHDGTAGAVAALIGALIGVPQPETEPAPIDPRRARERAEEALGTYFHALALQRTVMLVLEDAHWADPFSLELTERIVDQGEGRSIFVLVLCRPELFEKRPGLFGGSDHQRVDLRPLTRRAGRALMHALLGGEPPAGLADDIAELTGGNPYFIEETLAGLRDRGALARDPAGAWQIVDDPTSQPVPASVEAVLQSRLDSLPAEEKELLKRTSVFGRAFWDEALSGLGIADGARLLGNLRSRDLIAPRASTRFAGVREFTFRHALMRDAAYALLPEAQRRVLHRAAAQFFLDRGDEDAAAIARHLDLGGDTGRSAEYHFKAAQRASAEDAAEMALEHAERGLSLTSDAALRFDLVALQVEVLDRLGRRHEQRRALERLPPLAKAIGEPWREAHWRMRMGQMQRMTAEYASAAGNLATALAIFQHLGRDADAIEALTELGSIAQSVGDYRQALDHIGDALTLCAKVRRPDLDASAHMVAANALLGLQELEQARRRYAASVDAFRALGDAYRQTVALVNLGNLYNALGRYPEAAESLETALALASRTSAGSSQAYIRANRGITRARLGQLDAAIESEQLAFKTAGEAGDGRLLSASGTYLALICLERGGERDLHRAQNAAVAALAAARDASLDEFQALAHMALARVYLARGETDAALREASEAVRLRGRMRGVQELEEDLYYTHHLALRAAGLTEESRAAIVRARDLVLGKASKLDESESRRCYLEGVPANRAILAAAIAEGIG